MKPIHAGRGSVSEQILREVNFIVGAIDGDTVKHARELVNTIALIKHENYMLRLERDHYKELCLPKENKTTEV